MTDTTPTEPGSRADRLVEVRTLADALLGSLPVNRLEARRKIIEALGFEPRAEELHAIGDIAAGRVGEGSLARLSRTFLVLRTLVENELAVVHTETELNPTRLREVSATLPRLLAEKQRLDAVLDRELESKPDLHPAVQKAVRRTCEALSPSREAIVTAMVLAPALEPLVANARQLPHQALPAVALCTVIENDLVMWRELATREGTDEVLAAREELLGRIQLDKIAYDRVGERLQQQQNSALGGGPPGLVEAIQKARQGLFATYRGLIPILQRGKDAITDPIVDEPETDAVDSVQLQERIEQAEVEARRVASERVSEEEVYLDALKNLRDGRTSMPVPAGKSSAESRARRVRMLAVVCGVVLAGTVGVHAWLINRERAPRPIQAEPSEFAHLLPITDIRPVGTMMYARVRDWDQLDEAERIRRTEDLGGLAAERGFSAVYLVDEGGESLAQWSRGRGVRLNGAETVHHGASSGSLSSN